MLCATSTREEVWQPPNRAAPAKASARLSDFFIVLVLVASIENEAVFALVAGGRRRVAGRAVDLVEAAEQDGGGIGGVLETIIRPRQILPRYRACDVRRHDDHQLGLAIDVVAALEQRAEHWQLHQAGEPADGVLRLLLDHAGHRECATGRDLDGGLGAAGLDRGNVLGALTR